MSSEYATFQVQSEALHSRTIRARIPDSFAMIAYVQSGSLRWNEGHSTLEGPGMCFWPHGTCPRLSLDAGARAFFLGLNDVLVSDALGARAESVHLRMLVERPFKVSLSEPLQIAKFETLLDWFKSELAEEQGQSPMTLAAYLRLLLLWALRLHRPEGIELTAEKTSILRQFRHLVELHYREHWLVTSYAEVLGVDYDRLHRICRRETGRTPAELVHERLTAEAKVRLEKSGLPIKRIAADLGFSDATRFSHFFKRRTDMSPGTFRAVVSRPDGENLGALKQAFADWP